MSDITSPTGDAASLKEDEHASAKFEICCTAVEQPESCPGRCFRFLERIGFHRNRPGRCGKHHCILEENTGNRCSMEGVFHLEKFRILFDALWSISVGQNRKLVGWHRKKSENFPKRNTTFMLQRFPVFFRRNPPVLLIQMCIDNGGSYIKI